MFFNKPIYIAGPCSAESEDQVMKTASEIIKTPKVSAFRAGLWKPRTRPGSFEGVGAQGLKWLNKVQSELNIPVATEVANAKHVEMCLEADIDVLWIGARTTVNPFLCQEIAEALRGTKKPIFVKNPINPDLNLWLGAIERISSAGIEEIVGVHRGFSTHRAGNYRNDPIWSIVGELKSKMPNLPIICDPSHICGEREKILEISMKATKLGMDGLMIETHITPEKALSDADQQITPKTLNELLNVIDDLNITLDNGSNDEILNVLREEIDLVDRKIASCLIERFNVVRKIGEHKQKNSMKIIHTERWQSLVGKLVEQAERNGVSRITVESIYEIIHSHSIQVQNDIISKSST